MACGALCLSIRLLTTLGTGDLVCILMGVEQDGKSNFTDSLGPYPSGGTLGMINYANTDDNCIKAVFSGFLEYLPYILLIQTLSLIVTEKFTFRIPRIAQRVERFYKVSRANFKITVRKSQKINVPFEKKFVKSIYSVIYYLVKKMFSRNFCDRLLTVKFRNLYTTVWNFANFCLTLFCEHLGKISVKTTQ